MNRISIKNQQKKIRVNQTRLKTLANNILKSQGLDKSELSIVLVNDEQIKKLNKLYLKKDRPTDVIAFRMSDGMFGKVNPDILGDVVLSVETAKKRAAQLKVSLTSEINLYLIHGILHLLGYTDKTKKGFSRMELLQEELLAAYA